MPRIEASTDFKKVREDLDKIKKRGKMVTVGDLLKDKEKDPKKKKGEDGEDEENASLSREERKKKYLIRADVVEAMNIAAELAIELRSPSMKLGAHVKKAGESGDATAPDATSSAE